jgi:hypothetical protein
LKIGGRQLKPVEQAGMLAAVMVIGLYGYLNFVYSAPSYKLQRVEIRFAEVRRAVEKLKNDRSTGRAQRDLERLRKRAAAAQRTLREVEGLLGERRATDGIATRVVQMASERGFMIQTYSRITDRARIREALGEEDPYELSYYRVVLRGRYGLVTELLEGLQTLPQLVVARRISIDAPDDGESLQTEIWFSI